jgi:hypothetical protein
MSTPLPDLIKAAYSVTRWHTMPNLKPQNLAAHSWGVALLIARLYDGPAVFLPALLRAALEHDLAESEIGDMPRPARTLDHRNLEAVTGARMGIMGEWSLPESVRPWLEWADLIEAGLHAQREAALGNSHFHEVQVRVNDYITANEDKIPPPLFAFAREAMLIL